MRVLVTGAGGFIGQAVCRALVASGHQVRAASRRAQASEGAPPAAGEARVESWPVREPAAEPDWAAALEGMQGVVHTGLGDLRSGEPGGGAAADGRPDDVAVTVALARAAAASGVERFVFLSTAKVHGERSQPEPDGGWHRYSELELPRPADAYAASKWEAERALRAIAGKSRLPCVVLRPPLVYGPGVGANFFRLLRAVHRRLPLPLASVRNLRSFVAADNLADLVQTSLVHPRAADRTYLVSDLEVSTPGLVQAMGEALRTLPRLFAASPRVLTTVGGLVGRRVAVERLLASLVVDARRVGEELGWRAPLTPEEALRETAQWYLAGGRPATR